MYLYKTKRNKYYSLIISKGVVLDFEVNSQICGCREFVGYNIKEIAKDFRDARWIKVW